MGRRVKIALDNSGKEAYPEIAWNGDMGKEYWRRRVLCGFDGAFPFEAYADDLWNSQFEVECPFCGNELLCDDYDGRHEPPWAEFWTKRFCDECGARIVVPEDSPSYSDYSYGNYKDIASCADIEGWTLFCDENNQRFHLLHDEHCQEALLNDWKVIRIEDIPKKEHD